jgi:glycosyltransferase involved in cell wall biosynthesis
LSAHAPFFSIVIPTYNRAGLLRRVLRSLQDQKFEDVEIIVSDNASTDDTPAVVREFGYEELQYYRQESNIGPAANFESALSHARGCYVIFHQDDDLLHPEFLRRAYSALVGRPEVVIYGSAVWKYVDTGRTQSWVHRACSVDPMLSLAREELLELDGRDLAALMLVQPNILLMPAIAYQREAIERSGFKVRNNLMGDVLITLDVALQGRVVYDPRPGAVCWKHTANYSVLARESDKKAVMASFYRDYVRKLSSEVVDWEDRVAVMLAGQDFEHITESLRNLLRYRGDPRLIRLFWIAAQKSHRGAYSRFFRRLTERLAWRGMFRLWAARRRWSRLSNSRSRWGDVP